MSLTACVTMTTLLIALLICNKVSSFTLTSVQRTFRPELVLNAITEDAAAEYYENENGRRAAEFRDLEPLEETEKRRARIEHDLINQERFVEYGNELWDLRKKMKDLSSRLIACLSGRSYESENKIRKQLRALEKQDPELTYRIELEEMQLAQRDGRVEDAEKHQTRALAARSCLPQFNLEGLWVGKYGEHGYEMINVTYSGDHLIAYKVTGDKNVPKGEITFQVDLNPLPPRVVGGKATETLPPIILTSKAAEKWGTSQLPRSKGLGQVAEPGFRNSQWMEGQLILIGSEYFSFAWVPIEQQIFFGRPSAELALKMLRESGSAPVSVRSWDVPPSLDEDVNVLKDFAASCLDKTTETFEDKDIANASFGCIWHGVDTEECYFQ